MSIFGWAPPEHVVYQDGPQKEAVSTEYFASQVDLSKIPHHGESLWASWSVTSVATKNGLISNRNFA